MALIALKQNDLHAAREYLAVYTGEPQDAQQLPTMHDLLVLWNSDTVTLKDTPINYFFPILPATLTGLPYDLRRPPYTPPLALPVAGGQPQAELSLITQEAAVTPASPATPPGEEPDYRVEEQPWYAGVFPNCDAIGAKEARQLSSQTAAVLITATDTELRAVMHLLTPLPHHEAILRAFVDQETYYLGTFGAYPAVVTKCRAGALGEGSVILATQHALSIWRPKGVIMIGIAFGRDPHKQRIGDVLVASQIISYEQQRTGKQVISRGPITPSNTTLLNRFENAPGWRFARPDGSPCALQFGPVLSGEKLVDDPAFKARLFKQYPQAIGGEMEGAGLCAAAMREGVAWVLVKSICDWADGNKHDRYHPLAAAAAASLAHHVLAQPTVLDSLQKRPA